MKALICFLFYTLTSTLTLHAQPNPAYWDSILVNGNYRSYLIKIPADYDFQTELPLVLNFHGGLIGTPLNQSFASQMNVKANQENFIVVYPQGRNILGATYWAAGECCGPTADDEVDVEFIDQLLDSWELEFPIDIERIYSTGLSNGGMFSYRLACELSERIAAIAPVAGTVGVPSCAPVRPVPIIHFHSYLDENVPWLGGEGIGTTDYDFPPVFSLLNARADVNNCLNDSIWIYDGADYDFFRWETCDCNAELELYITHDGGHSWPGGIGGGDPASSVIDANDLMWDFFMAHPLSCDSTNNVGDQPLSELIIFPNPCNERLNFVLPSYSGTSKYTITNSMGERIYNGIISKPETEISVNGFTSGLYILHIQTQGFVINKTFIIER